MPSLFSDERGPGAFVSLGALPRRKHAAPRRLPVFHLDAPDSDDDKPPAAVPFPTSSPPSPTRGPPPAHPPRRGSVSQILPNGKPLKSSLKSSSSSPSISPPNSHIHLRARSEPSTPALPHKNVHFPDPECDLATIRVFNRSARPAALSNPSFDETETEGEDPPPDRFPFPASSSTLPYEIDPAVSSPIPSPQSSPLANIFLESLSYSPSPSQLSDDAKPHLTGSILVRNIAYEKHVAVRFTLDDWQTVSEVSARYSQSVPSLPSKFPQHPPDHPRTTVGDLFGPLPHATTWDRFKFTIRLEDYAYALSTRVLWLATRYRVTSTYPIDASTTTSGPGGEWWDNNAGANYRVSFRPAVLANARPRRETAPEPIVSPLTTPPPSTCREHALGLFVPTAKSKATNKTLSPFPSQGKTTWPRRAGTLNLSNYAAPPTVHSPPSLSTKSPPSISITPPKSPPQNHDEDSSSPASSTLSTPAVSPLMVPHVIIGGHPATAPPYETSDGHDTSRSGHVRDWEWTAPRKGSPPPAPAPAPPPQPQQPPPQRTPPHAPQNTHSPFPRFPNVKSFAAGQNDPLYKAFVTQWCFAQGPAPAHAYGGDGVLA